MNLEQFNKKLDKPTYFLGLAALVIFMPMIGYMFGWAITVEFETIQYAFADQLSEGHNYIVTIADGIGTADHLS